MRVCTKCGENKLLSDYYSPNREGHAQSWCKECVKAASRAWRKANPEKKRAWYLANKASEIAAQRFRNYGVTPAQFDTMLINQRGRCAICTKAFSDSLSPQLDHCKATMKVRGLLCRGCNTGIGSLDHNVQNLRAAIEYLTP